MNGRPTWFCAFICGARVQLSIEGKQAKCVDYRYLLRRHKIHFFFAFPSSSMQSFCQRSSLWGASFLGVGFRLKTYFASFQITKRAIRNRLLREEANTLTDDDEVSWENK